MTPLSTKELEEIRERAKDKGNYLPKEAIRSAAEFLQKRLAKEKCDSMSVDCCSRCNAFALSRFAPLMLDRITDIPRLLETIEHLQKYQQHSKDCAKWGWVWHSESGCALYELRDYNVFGKIACTCGLVEKEG